MKKICVIAGVCMALFGQAPAYGQAGALFSQFQLDASLPLQFSTNTLLTPTNPKSDFWSSPSLKLSAIGWLDPSLKYQTYFFSNPEPYWRVHAAEDASEIFGARIDKTLQNNFSTGAYYEHGFVFNGLYNSVAFQANDFAGFVAYTYVDKVAGLTVVPTFTTTYRLADDVSQDRVVFNLKATIIQQLTDKWSLMLLPILKYYAYTDGTNAGKRNLYPSALVELDYSLNNDVTLGGSIEYDRQWSNFAASNFTNVTFLVSVTFGHRYDLLPKEQTAAVRRIQ